ncbi:MAG TPA: hypothetical protein VHZ07_24545 [Bryobacteraceae bacterium]|nr:hypothetical protein [Bryobacteraceae bacterium]
MRPLSSLNFISPHDPTATDHGASVALSAFEIHNVSLTYLSLSPIIAWR